jgi:hypothetical protein
MPSKFFVDDCPERTRRIRDLLRLLYDEGRAIPAVSPNVSPDVKPPWFDEEKFKRGQSFAFKYTVR